MRLRIVSGFSQDYVLDKETLCSAYYEVTVVEPGAGGVIVVGAVKSSNGSWPGGHLGHHVGSFGYHMDDGTFQTNCHVDISGVCSGLAKGDVVGVGWSSWPNHEAESYFATKNGQFLGKVQISEGSAIVSTATGTNECWYPAVTGTGRCYIHYKLWPTTVRISSLSRNQD